MKYPAILFCVIKTLCNFTLQTMYMTLTIFTTANYNYSLIEPKKPVSVITFGSAEQFESWVENKYQMPKIEVAKYRKSNRRLTVYSKIAQEFFKKYAK